MTAEIHLRQLSDSGNFYCQGILISSCEADALPTADHQDGGQV